jgi:hypothetical protein
MYEAEVKKSKMCILDEVNFLVTSVKIGISCIRSLEYDNSPLKAC